MIAIDTNVLLSALDQASGMSERGFPMQLSHKTRGIA
jgi:predicted nucleic acid-binding protein